MMNTPKKPEGAEPRTGAEPRVVWIVGSGIPEPPDPHSHVAQKMAAALADGEPAAEVLKRELRLIINEEPQPDEPDPAAARSADLIIAIDPRWHPRSFASSFEEPFGEVPWQC